MSSVSPTQIEMQSMSQNEVRIQKRNILFWIYNFKKIYEFLKVERKFAELIENLQINKRKCKFYVEAQESTTSAAPKLSSFVYNNAPMTQTRNVNCISI